MEKALLDLIVALAKDVLRKVAIKATLSVLDEFRRNTLYSIQMNMWIILLKLHDH